MDKEEYKAALLECYNGLLECGMPIIAERILKVIDCPIELEKAYNNYLYFTIMRG